MSVINVGVLQAVLDLKDNLTPALNAIAPSIEQLGGKIAKAGFAILPLSAAIEELGATSLRSAVALNEGLGNVGALLTDVAADQVPGVMASMKNQVQSLAVEFGKSTEDISAGLYEVVSILGYTKDTFAQLEIAAKAGSAGLATTKEAFNALSAVTLTYGDVSKEAFQKAADLSFQAVNLGKITFPELASSIGKVAPMAAQAGVKIEDLYAALTAASGVTGSVSQGATQVTSAINALLNPTKQMETLFRELDVANGKVAISEFGFVDVLKKVLEFAEKTGTPLMKLTRRKEANTVATSLGVQQYGRFRDILGEMEKAYTSNSNVLEGAFYRQKQTINAVGFQWDQFKARVQITLQTIGDALLPVFGKFIQLATPMVEWLTKMAEWFDKLPMPVKELAVMIGLFMAALGPVVIAIGGLVIAFAALEPFFPVIALAFSALVPLVLGVGAAIVLLITYWDDLKDAMEVAKFTPLGEFLDGFISGTLSLLGETLTMLSNVVYVFTLGFVDLKATVQNASTFFDALNLTWVALKYTVVNLAQGFLYLYRAMHFDGDPMKVEIQKDIDALEKLKLNYSDTANAIVNGTDKAKKAIKEYEPPISQLNDALKKLGPTVKGVGDVHQATAAEVKKHAKEMEDASKWAQKLRVEFLKMRQESEEAAFKTGMADLSAVLGDAAKQAGILETKTLPIKVQVAQAAIEAKLNALNVAEWNKEVDKLAKEYGLTDQQVRNLKKSADDVKEKTSNWHKVLTSVSEAFKIMGVSADSTFGRIITALTAVSSISQETQKIVGTDSKTSWKKFLEADGADKGKVALQALNVAMIAYKSGALAGAAAGAQFGASFGPWGIAIGGAIGGLLGFFGASSRARAEAEKLSRQINQQRNDFITAQGGYDQLARKAKALGLTLDGLFNAKNLNDYNAAVKQLTDAFDMNAKANEEMNAIMEKYGLTISDLGEKFRQQKLDEMALVLIHDWEWLNKLGVDQTTILEKMAPEMNKYVQEVIRAGGLIPENLRPIIEKLIEMGLLLDDQGNKITDISQLNFTKSLNDQVKDLIASIQKLINTLLGIPNVDYTVTEHRRTQNDGGDNKSQGDGGGDGVPMASGFNGWVNGPTRILAGEAGREHLEVVPEEEWKKRQEATSATQADLSPTFIVNVTLPGEPVMRFVERGTKTNQIRIHPNSVKTF